MFKEVKRIEQKIYLKFNVLNDVNISVRDIKFRSTYLDKVMPMSFKSQL